MLKAFPTFLFLLFISGLLSLESCSYDNADEFYSGNICDTTNVTYSSTVEPIIATSCIACHFAGNSNGVDLETYADIKAAADDGSLLGSIKHEAGWEPMPKNGKLDDCSITKIEKWIQEGSLNN